MAAFGAGWKPAPLTSEPETEALPSNSFELYHCVAENEIPPGGTNLRCLAHDAVAALLPYFAEEDA
jgi:hypothetical protein